MFLFRTVGLLAGIAISAGDSRVSPACYVYTPG